MSNDEFFRKQGDRIRAIAEKADPFTKSRLLVLARTYDTDKRPPNSASVDLPPQAARLLAGYSHL